MEFVLDDFEDLLLVGRLLLPGKVITGGSTAAGGTCIKIMKKRMFACCVYLESILNVAKLIYFSKLGKKTLYFLLLAGVKSLNLSHVPNGEEEITI